MTQLRKIKKTLKQNANFERAENYRVFFKNSKNDIFLGINAAMISQIAKDFHDVSLADVLSLMKSNVHDERSLANKILCIKYKKGDATMQETLFKFYIKNRKWIRDWDGVDDNILTLLGLIF